MGHHYFSLPLYMSLSSVDWHSLLIYLYGAQKRPSRAAFHHFLVQLPSFLYSKSKFQKEANLTGL